MADDLAFLFADPEEAGGPRARRKSRPTVPAVPHPAVPPPTDINWVTLREAHEITSIPISTLRKWAKKGKVRGRLARSEGKDLRLLAMSDVLSRAAQLGRSVQPLEPEIVVDLRQSEVPAVDLASEAQTEEQSAPTANAGSSQSPTTAASADGDGSAPEGSILVPLEAWERLLGQLGNLHEAGQQLGDARERAAKAETEVEFLRERMRELRKRAEEAELAVDLAQNRSALPLGSVIGERPFQTRWRHWRDIWLR